MPRRSIFVLTFALVLVHVGAAMGASEFAPASTPVIQRVEPANPAPSPNNQQLTITGQDFLQGLTLTVADPGGNRAVYQGDAIRGRTATVFQVSVALTTAGNYSLVVTNTDGGISPPFALTVRSAPKPQAPVIEKITPAEPTKRNDAQPLLVEGQQFAAGLRAVLTDPMGQDVSEITVGKITPNSFELVARLEHSGEYSLVVTNPSGAVSNVRRFLVR